MKKLSKKENEYKKEIKILKYASSLLVSQDRKDIGTKTFNYRQGKRILYSVWSIGKKGKGFRSYGEEIVSEIGAVDPKSMATNLYNPLTKSFYTKEEIDIDCRGTLFH